MWSFGERRKWKSLYFPTADIPYILSTLLLRIIINFYFIRKSIFIITKYAVSDILICESVFFWTYREQGHHYNISQSIMKASPLSVRHEKEKSGQKKTVQKKDKRCGFSDAGAAKL